MVSFSINLYNGISLPHYVPHSVSDSWTENMVETWFNRWGHSLETFHQHILRATTNKPVSITTRILNGTINKPFPFTPYPFMKTEWLTNFPVNTTISSSTQNILTVTTTPPSFSTVLPYVQNYLTDDNYTSADIDITRILQAEDWYYITVLALVVILLCSVGGYHMVINLFHCCSTFHTKPRCERVPV